MSTVQGTSSVYLINKRCFDFIVSILLLILICPLLLMCIALIKLADPGPAIYSQWRVGKNQMLFRIYKLRSMYLNAESGQAKLAENSDNRIIGLCRWMRISHVDELPQLWNVIKGEMSLVGPRPERPEIIKELNKDLPEFVDRLAVKPGITGLAQISSGYVNTLQGMSEKLKYDLRYIKTMNWRQDIGIIFRTFSRFWDVSAN